MSEEKNLPTLAELHQDIGEAKQIDKLNKLLNQPPHSKWVKKHPLAKTKNDKGETVPASYIPIDKIEHMLTYIFQEWHVEVIREGVMFNAVYVTVRLHLKNPLTGKWFYQDGVGAKSVQTDSGTSAASLANIKDAAVMMALPSAKSYAIKDAAEHLGKLFGRDLNRRNSVEFEGAYEHADEVKPTKPVKQEDIKKANENYSYEPVNKKTQVEEDFEL